MNQQEHEQHNNFTELAAKLTLQGGHVHWNETVIGGWDGEPKNFRIADPLAQFRRVAPRNPLKNISTEQLEDYLHVTRPTDQFHSHSGLEPQLEDSRKLRRKRQDEDDPNDFDRTRETEAGHRARVRAASKDKRSAAFDLLPSSNETLHDWHGRLHTLVNPNGAAHPYFGAVKGFLERTGGLKRIHQLSRPEQRVLAGIVARIAEAA
jgi:hypothetical protein